MSLRLDEQGRITDAGPETEAFFCPVFERGMPFSRLLDLGADSVSPVDGWLGRASLEGVHQVDGCLLRTEERLAAELTIVPVVSGDRADGFAVSVRVVRERTASNRASRGGEEQLHAEISPSANEELLEMIIAGEPLEMILERLARFVEANAAESTRTAVLLLEEEGKCVADVVAPSLEPKLTAELRGVPLGACPPPLATESMESDADQSIPTAFDGVLRRHGVGIRYCEPVEDARGQRLGIFAVLSEQAIAPSTRTRELVRRAARMASIALVHVRNREALVRREARHRALIAGVPDLIFRIGRDGRFVDVHAHDERLLAKPRDAMLGRRLDEVLDEKLARKLQEAIADALDRGTLRTVEYSLTPVSGKRHFFEARITVPDSQEVFVVVRDVTDRITHERELIAMKEEAEAHARAKNEALDELRKRKRALTESEAKFRSLVEQSLVGIVTLREGRLQYVNPRVAEIFGFSVEEMKGREVKELIHEEDRPIVAANIEKRVRGVVDEIRYEARGRHRDGSVIHLELHGTRVELDGEIHLISSVLDVTERRQAQAELRLGSKALAAAANGILIADREGQIVWANPAFTELTGYEVGEVMGEHTRMLSSGEQDAAFYEDLWRTVLSGNVWKGELTNRRKDGTLYPEEMTITPVRDEYGEVAHFIAIKQDIRPRKEYEAGLIRAKERAEEMSRLKSVFLNNISHEIRTPLTTMIGFADILVEETTGQQRELVDMIRLGSDRLLEMFNGLFDFARLEAGGEKLRPERMDVGQMMESIVARFRTRGEAHGLAFDVDLPAPGECLGRYDRRAIQRITHNLLSNAFKFTEEGKVRIRLRAESGGLTIEVSDTGVGIEDAFLPHLFEPFRQESEGLGREYEGGGLGLAVVRHFVDLARGTIEVDTAKGEGTTFRVWLPDETGRQRQVDAA